MEGIIYLDNAATSYPKPEEVYSYMDKFYRNYGVNPGRSGYDLCVEAGAVVDNTRRLLTEFFNGDDPDRLCFCYNSTDALNIIISGILQSGDHAITTTVEHNSVLRPLYHQHIYNGVELDYVKFDCNGFVDPDNFKKLFKKNTKLVVVNHASNVVGTIQPIREIGKICKENGVIFAVDVSQSAGKIPIDVKEQYIDVLAFTGHKSLYGPTGIGGLYVNEGVEIRHTRAGGTGVRSAVRTHLFEYPYRLEYGTVNLLGVAGLNAGVRWVKQKGVHQIHSYEIELVTKLRDGLREIDRVILYCQDNLKDHIAVLLFNIEGIEAADVGMMLDVDYNVASRTGLHCAPLVHEQLGIAEIHGGVRFGVGIFNTEEDIEKAIEAVREISKGVAVRRCARNDKLRE